MERVRPVQICKIAEDAWRNGRAAYGLSVGVLLLQTKNVIARAPLAHQIVKKSVLGVNADKAVIRAKSQNIIMWHVIHIRTSEK